jgi:hypothetical protein
VTTSQAAKMGAKKWRINGGAQFFILIFGCRIALLIGFGTCFASGVARKYNPVI